MYLIGMNRGMVPLIIVFSLASHLRRGEFREAGELLIETAECVIGSAKQAVTERLENLSRRNR